MKKIKIGFAMCGSFCTIAQALNQMKTLISEGYEITPIFSQVVYNTNTRFTEAQKLIAEVEALTGNKIIHTIEAAEPIGPKKMFDALAVCPCTGNTLAKLANGVTDTSVTMAAKSHIRNGRPVILGIATNDALGASARNIGQLLNTRNYYFVPFGQDDPHNKPRSIIADFDKLNLTIISALNGVQLQPILI